MLRAFLVISFAVLMAVESKQMNNIVTRRENPVTTIETLAEYAIRAMAISYNSQCVSDACVGVTIDASTCTSFCTFLSSQLVAVFTEIEKCWLKPFCGLDFDNVPLPSFKLPILVPGYNGSCTLNGDNVVLSLSVLSHDVKKVVDIDIPFYDVILKTLIIWKGSYSVSCTPVAPAVVQTTPTEVVNGFCPIRLVANFLKVVDGFFGCKISINNLPEPVSSTDKPFTDSVTIRQNTVNEYIISFYKPHTVVQDCFVSNRKIRSTYTFNLGSKIPGSLSEAIKKGISDVLYNYNFLYNFLNVFNAPITASMVYKFIQSCPKCSISLGE